RRRPPPRDRTGGPARALYTRRSRRRAARMSTRPGWQLWIDRGGTFTDVIARSPDGRLLTRKLLSDDPGRYDDAPAHAILETLAAHAAPAAVIDVVRLGTTVATNALLERRGVPTVLVATAGFGDALRI